MAGWFTQPTQPFLSEEIHMKFLNMTGAGIIAGLTAGTVLFGFMLMHDATKELNKAAGELLMQDQVNEKILTQLYNIENNYTAMKSFVEAESIRVHARLSKLNGEGESSAEFGNLPNLWLDQQAPIKIPNLLLDLPDFSKKPDIQTLPGIDWSNYNINIDKFPSSQFQLPDSTYNSLKGINESIEAKKQVPLK